MLEKYGVKYSFQSIELKEKSKQTCLIKYGVKHISQNTEIHNKQQLSGFKIKHFKDTNIYYRGAYELDFLEKYYNKYFDIINGPTIEYIFKNKRRIYFPDFYISSLNLIVECKNSYLVNRDKDKIAAKEKATIASGFNYLIIIDKKYPNYL